jgi:ribonuclease HI
MNNPKTQKVSFIDQHKQYSQEDGGKSIVVFCDGSGCRPDGKGSGFAWIQPQTGQRHIEHIDGLTNNQAEYRALISAISSLADESAVQVFTDSQLMWSQIIGNYKVNDPELAQLLFQVRDVIKKKQLKFEVQWIPRRENLAGKLL